MRHLVFGLLLVLFSSLTATAQQTAKGTVFLDANNNGTLDSGENGIADVAVSNGRDVVTTDENGAYELPVDDDDIIFVIKPGEYRFPVDENNLPQFYYIHKPQGSPELKFEGVKPTGPLPETINFGLLEGDDSEAFNILVFGDPQPYTEQQVQYFDQDIVDELAGVEGYEFGITLGDIVGDDLDLFGPYIQSISRIGIPWFNVYGNHDMNYDAESNEYADETFEATFGPATYAFNQGKVHFILLDDVIYPREDGKNGYIGGFTEEQLQFIENDLKHVPRDHLVVVAFHIPVAFSEQNKGSFRPSDQQRLFELIDDYQNTLSLSAHTHIQGLHFLDDQWGWTGEKPHVHYNVGTTSGDWWSGEPDEEGIPPTLMRDGTPNGYAKLHFDGSQFTFDYKAARADEDKKMSIWGPKVVPHDEWFGAELFVNYYLGSDSTKVEYRVDGKGKWRSMRRVEMGDPFVASLREKWDTADTLIPGKRPSNPVPSSHLWKTGVPNHLPEGEHTIEIKVTDIFGRHFHEEFTYRIEDR